MDKYFKTMEFYYDVALRCISSDPEGRSKYVHNFMDRTEVIAQVIVSDFTSEVEDLQNFYNRREQMIAELGGEYEEKQ